MVFQIVAAVLLGVRREREANEGLKAEFDDDKCPEKVDTHVFVLFPSFRCTTVPQKLPVGVAAVLHVGRAANFVRGIFHGKFRRVPFELKLAACQQGYSRPRKC